MTNYDNRMMRSTPGTSPRSAQSTGVIAHWNREKGWGFIRRSDGKPDLFAHVRHLVDDLDELAIGQKVSFEVGTNPKNGRPEALDVRLVS
jgi:cold shock CspA family protein